MKRNALKWSAGLIAGFATLLASCGTDYKLDTVLQLDKADVTAVAYPGVNMISWEPIASAKNYTVYVYEEDVYKGTLAPNGNSAFDTDIVNDKDYTYYVVANSNTDPAKVARAVVVENSMGSDSVTAIVPPIGTKALDLVAYEDGYDGEVLTPDTEEDEYILTADRVKTFVNGSGLFVSFPAKAYLRYDFKLYDKALGHVFYSSANDKIGIDGSVSINSNNIVAQKNLTGFGGGKYQLVVEVSAKGTAATNGINPAYDTTELVIGDVEIAKLVVNGLSNPSVYYVYTNTSNDVVRITLPRVTKADGSAVPADWYKVYRSTDGAYETTEITSTKNKILDSESRSWAYYIDDKVPDVNVSYTYYMVLTDGKSYSDLKQNSLQVKTEYGVDTSWVSAEGNQDKDKDLADISGGVEWEIWTSAKKATDIKAYVVLGENGRFDDLVADEREEKRFASEIRAKGKDVSENIAPTSYGSFVVRTVTQGTSGTPVYLLVVVNEAGKKEASTIVSYTPWFK